MTTAATMRVDLRALDNLATKWSGVAQSITRDSGRTKKVVGLAAQLLTGEMREYIVNMPRNSRFPRQGGGDLARSFRPVGKVNQRSLYVATVSEAVHARIQDVGGIITPRTQKSLAIPLIPMAIGKWPRHWAKGKLFWIPTTRVLWRRVNKLRNEAVYALAKRVRIPAKRYSAKVIEQASPKVAEFLIAKLVMEGLRNGPQ